jgi:hypothetical protein
MATTGSGSTGRRLGSISNAVGHHTRHARAFGPGHDNLYMFHILSTVGGWGPGPSLWCLHPPKTGGQSRHCWHTFSRKQPQSASEALARYWRSAARHAHAHPCGRTREWAISPRTSLSLNVRGTLSAISTVPERNNRRALPCFPPLKGHLVCATWFFLRALQKFPLKSHFLRSTWFFCVVLHYSSPLVLGPSPVL